MKYAMYVIAAIIVIYWAVAFFLLHALPTIHIILILALASVVIGKRYDQTHGHFLD